VATEVSPLRGGQGRRLLLYVGLAAAAAVAAVIGVTLLQTRGETTSVPGAVTKARSGPPLLQLELGLRSDAEARALARAEALFDAKDRRIAPAAAIFRRYDSVEAQLGLAFTSWRGPSSLATVKTIAAAHLNDPAALLNLGWADYQAGRNADAATAWRQTATRYPDSPYGVDAEDALHGGPPGLPPLVTGLAVPKALANLPAAEQVAALKRAAAAPDARAKLLYGALLWNYLRRPVSAEREFAAAAKLAPHDAVARVAAAVGLFSKASPRRAFGRLGPLTAVFPHSAAVEFHLGALLVYIAEYRKATRHLRSALADGPHSPYAQPARTLLASLARTRSK
jgi:tetratricopeptide (TPR) repeat protein